MKHFAPGPPDQVVRRDALRTTATLRAEPPAGGKGEEIILTEILQKTFLKRLNNNNVNVQQGQRSGGRDEPHFAEYRRTF